MIWWYCDDDDDDDDNDDNGDDDEEEDEDEDDGDGDDNDNDGDNDDEFLYFFSIFKVFFPKIGKMGTCGSGWELLNLDTSSILSMPDDHDITIQYNTIQYNTIQILLSTPHGGFSETNINSTGNQKNNN